MDQKIMIKFPKIKQLRDVVSDVKFKNDYLSIVNSDGTIEKRVRTNTASYPKIEFTGTVKVHGTNCGVVIQKDSIYAMSRKNVISVEEDHYGFAQWLEERKQYFSDYKEQHYPKSDFLVIYGEYFGKGIQKKVAVNQLEDKYFMPFDMFTYNEPEDFLIDIKTWHTVDMDIAKVPGVVLPYIVAKVEIDFSQPAKVVNSLIEMTEKVEKECPVARRMGVLGIGEGIVWRAEYNNLVYRFKVKGEKHSSSKVKKLTAVDTEKMKSIDEFVEYAVTESRFTQAIEEVMTHDENYEVVLDKSLIGPLLNWMKNDIASEESDTLQKSGLTMRDVVNAISNKTKIMFFELEQKDCLL